MAAAALRSVFEIRRRRKRVVCRIVAESKMKPVSLIRQVCDAGHRSFGENYVQEIIEKAPQLPEDIEQSEASVELHCHFKVFIYTQSERSNSKVGYFEIIGSGNHKSDGDGDVEFEPEAVSR